MLHPVTFNGALDALLRFLRRPEVRVAALLILCAGVTSLQATSGTPEELATNVGTQAKPWIYWVIRLLAGAMAAGGLLSLIGGFTGHEEGFAKAAKVFGGLVLMGVGIYCLANPGTIYTTLNLDGMFKATV